MGKTPLEQAQIESWQRLVEFNFLVPVGMCFQHSTGLRRIMPPERASSMGIPSLMVSWI